MTRPAIAVPAAALVLLLGAAPFAIADCPDFVVAPGYPLTHPEANAVLIEDFNADGFRDLAITTRTHVTILLGNGDGTFDPETSYATAAFYSRDVASGDFNGDARLDLAVANYYSANVSVLLGNGDGTFGAPTLFTTGSGSTPTSVAAGDVNGDGNADLVVTKDNPSAVVILIGNGSGSFAYPVTHVAGVLPASVAIGHFNSDSWVDLAVANTSSGNVSILLGTGGGNFATAVNYGANGGPKALVIGNFNGDGSSDLAVVNYSNVSVLLGNGDGTFAAAVSYTVGENSLSLAVGEFNGDTKSDLAVANNYSNNVAILLGDGVGGFVESGRFGSDRSPTSVAVGDLDGDGLSDLAVTNSYFNDFAISRVTILIGTGQGAFDAPAAFVAGKVPSSIAVADYNGDGVRDLATANDDSGDVSILVGSGSGTFAAPLKFAVAGDPRSIVHGDFNGDGFRDLATANFFADNISVLLGNGNGTFLPAVHYSVGETAFIIRAGDFNGDGKTDLAVARTDDKVGIFIGNGNGTFAAPATYAAGDFPGEIAVDTINGDTRSDVVAANRDLDSVSVRLANADGTLGAATTYAVGAGPRAMAVGDFNGDGVNDLAVANASSTTSNNVSILLGAGNGTFGAAVGYTANPMPWSLAVSDFNGDGKLDLVVSSSQWYVDHANIAILLGGGDGTFGTPTMFEAGNALSRVVTADFNGDGTNDLILAGSYLATDVTFVANRSTCASLSGMTPNSGSIAGGQSTVISGTNISGAVSVTFGGAAGTITGNTPTSITVTTPAHAAGVVDVVVATAGGAATLPGGYTFIGPSAAPTGLVAAGVSALQVNLTWNTVSGATSYQIDRKGAAGDYMQIGTSGTASYSDTSVSSAMAYLYRVRAVNLAGPSPNSLPDVATTIVFTDNPLSAGTTVKAAHLAELRVAINTVRALAGLSDASFTDTASAGTAIKAIHMSELRTALDAALGALSLTSGGYTDALLTGIAVRALHVQELRSRM